METQVTVTTVNADTLAEQLDVALALRMPLFIWGSPGIGKSQIGHQFAARHNALLIDERASQKSDVDTRGIPYVSTEGTRKVTRWAAPSWIPTEAGDYPYIVVFLDELNSALRSTQAAHYQLILDRCLGDARLADNVVVIAAGNLETDRAVTERMSTALAARFTHAQLVVDNDAWERWALSADLHVSAPFYMRWRPEALHEFDPRSSSKAQPNPRAWERVARIAAHCEANPVRKLTEDALYKGTVGEVRGTEFAGFLQIFRELPDPAGVILNPDAADIPQRVDVLCALAGALAERATEKNFDRIAKYAERLRDARHAGPEFMTTLVRSAASHCPAIQHTRAFIAWAAANSDVLM